MSRDCPRCQEPMIDLGLGDAQTRVDRPILVNGWECLNCGEEWVTRPSPPVGYRSEIRSAVARVLANRRPT